MRGGEAVRGVLVAAWLGVGVLACPSCRGVAGRREAAPGASGQRQDTARAIALNREALGSKDDLAKAERLLLAAIEADVFYGPAHNNLGVVYLKQGRYYQAAWKFQQAARLMPRETEPLVNLAEVFETVGRLAEARAELEKALERDGTDPAATAALCRVLVRLGERTPRVARLLERLVLEAEDPVWRAWAQGELIKLRARLEIPPEGPATRPAGPG